MDHAQPVLLAIALAITAILLAALGRRWRRGERITKAHRSHLYQ